MYLLRQEYTLEIRFDFCGLEGITRKIIAVLLVSPGGNYLLREIRTLANPGIAIHGQF